MTDRTGCLRGRQLLDRLDGIAGHNVAAERSEVRPERVGNSLCAAARQRPPDHMRKATQHQRDRSGRQRVERNHAVRSDACEQRPRALAGKISAAQSFRRLQRDETKARERNGVSWHRRRRKNRVANERPRIRDSPQQTLIATPSPPKPRAVSATERITSADGTSSSNGWASITGGSIQESP